MHACALTHKGVGGGGEGKRESEMTSSNQADKGASDNSQSLCELYRRVFFIRVVYHVYTCEHFACV